MANQAHRPIWHHGVPKLFHMRAMTLLTIAMTEGQRERGKTQKKKQQKEAGALTQKKKSGREQWKRISLDFKSISLLLKWKPNYSHFFLFPVVFHSAQTHMEKKHWRCWQGVLSRRMKTKDFRCHHPYFDFLTLFSQQVCSHPLHPAHHHHLTPSTPLLPLYLLSWLLLTITNGITAVRAFHQYFSICTVSCPTLQMSHQSEL